MFYSLLFSLFSMVSSYMISGGVGTMVSSLLARVFTVGKPCLVVVAVQGALGYNPTISKSRTPSPITINPPLSDKLEDPMYPGEGWALFDTSNPGHYPLVFSNNKGQSEVAKYICFRSTEEDTYLVGT